MKHKTFNNALALALFIFGLAWLGPSLDADDWRSAAGDAAVQEHRAEIKRLQAAIKACGNENATPVEIDDGVFHCLSTGGRVLTARADK